LERTIWHISLGLKLITLRTVIDIAIEVMMKVLNEVLRANSSKGVVETEVALIIML
jgi:hypothetical protein